MNNRQAAGLGVGAALALCVPHASAQLASPETLWTGGAGNWFETGRWTNDRPGSYQTSAIDHFALTNWTGPYYNHSLISIDGGPVTLFPSVTTVYYVSGDPSLRYSSLSFVPYLVIIDLAVGNSGTGTLKVGTGFELVAANVMIGKNAGSVGTLESSGTPVNGSGVGLNCSGDMVIGESGTGTLNVLAGSVVEYWDEVSTHDQYVSVYDNHLGHLAGSNGSLKVSGSGSECHYTTTAFSSLQRTNGLIIGETGTGGVTVDGGGKLITRAARLGYATAATGSGSISGTGSRWENDSQIYVGERGHGSLAINSGGVLRTGFGDFHEGTTVTLADTNNTTAPVPVRSDYGSIGVYAGSVGSVVVSDADSRWEQNANLIVGVAGSGSLTIGAGGTVASAPRVGGPYPDVAGSILGQSTGGTGTVKVSGNGAHWQNGGGLIIGQAGTGTLTVGSGGTVDVQGDPIQLGVSGSGTLIFGGDATAGVGTLGGTIIQGGSGSSTVRFQHNQTFTPTHQFNNIGTIENVGPGTTILPGRLQSIGNLRASGGTLEVNRSSGTPSFNTVTLAGGNIILNGVSTVLPVNPLLDGSVLNGNLSLTNGAQLTAALGISGTNGIITVDGAGSKFIPRPPTLTNNFIVGDGGAGSLIVRNGGQVPVNPSTLVTTIGYGTAGSGTVQVTGLTSQLTAGTTTIGRQGSGTVNLQTYGALRTTNGLLGDLAGSHGTVSISGGASWLIDQNALTIGRAGSGRIELAGGGILRVGPSGQGVVTASQEQGSSATIQIGTGGSPGNLYASSIVSGPYSSPLIQFYHNSTAFTFPLSINEADIRILDGNTGTTTLTNNVILGSVGITTGGLRAAEECQMTCTGGSFVIGDVSSQNPGGDYVAPFFSVDGIDVNVNIDSLIVGQGSPGELRLKNSSVLTVGRSPNFSEIPLDGTVIFGGGGDNPGDLTSAGVRGVTSRAKVVFDHPYDRFSLSSPLLGSIAVEHKGSGLSKLTGTVTYTGTTSVTAGTLLFTQYLNNSAATVSGTGVIGGENTIGHLSIQSGGSIAPGNSPGTIGSLRVGVLNLAAGGRFQIDLGPNLTCDQVLNDTRPGVYLDTSFTPPTTGTVTFDFKFRGMNQNGVYPVFTRSTMLTADFLSRLAYTSDFPLQGSFRQTKVGTAPFAYYQLEFVTTSYDSPAYDRWARDVYGLSLTGNGRPEADADNDGMMNMMEFVLGSSPVSGAASRLPVMTRSAGNGVFTFQHRIESASQFGTTVQYSGELAHWTNATAGQLATSASGSTGFETITATVPIPAGGRAFFMRLKVTPLSP